MTMPTGSPSAARPTRYRHAALLNHARGDWAFSVARRYLYETADAVRLARAGALVARAARAAGRQDAPRGDLPPAPRRRLAAAPGRWAPDVRERLAMRPRAPVAGRAGGLRAAGRRGGRCVRAGLLPEPMARTARGPGRRACARSSSRSSGRCPTAAPATDGRTRRTDDFAWLHGEFTMVARSEEGGDVVSSPAGRTARAARVGRAGAHLGSGDPGHQPRRPRRHRLGARRPRPRARRAAADLRRLPGHRRHAAADQQSAWRAGDCDRASRSRSASIRHGRASGSRSRSRAPAPQRIRAAGHFRRRAASTSWPCCPLPSARTAARATRRSTTRSARPCAARSTTAPSVVSRSSSSSASESAAAAARIALPFGAWQSTLTRSPRTPPRRSSPGTEDHLAAMRHSAAHMMAAAVLELFPEAKLGIGPAIRDGFYYDFDLPRPLTPADLEQIEAKMREQQAARPAPSSARRTSPAPRRSPSSRRKGQPFKVEIVERPARVGGSDRQLLPPRRRSRTCAAAGTSGPRRSSAPSSCSTRPAPTGAATRRGRCSSASTAPPGTRQEELDQHLWRIEEAKKRDHRKLGRELDLFTFHPESPAAPFLHPARHGALARARGLVAPGPSRGRLRRGPHAEPGAQGAVGDERPLGQLPGQHVRPRRPRPRLRAEADELPGGDPHLQDPRALVPRAADALRRLLASSSARSAPASWPACSACGS